MLPGSPRAEILPNDPPANPAATDDADDTLRQTAAHDPLPRTTADIAVGDAYAAKQVNRRARASVPRPPVREHQACR